MSESSKTDTGTGWASTTGLERCPSCGNKTGLKYEFSGSCGFVECQGCGTTGPLDDEAADPLCDVGAALAAWNRRKPAEGGCPWCGCTGNLYRQGESGEWTFCGDCDARWPTEPNL